MRAFGKHYYIAISLSKEYNHLLPQPLYNIRFASRLYVYSICGINNCNRAIGVRKFCGIFPRKVSLGSLVRLVKIHYNILYPPILLLARRHSHKMILSTIHCRSSRRRFIALTSSSSSSPRNYKISDNIILSTATLRVCN